MNTQNRNHAARASSNPNRPALRLTPLAAALAAGLFALPSAPANAATIAVVNGGCTLIDAITAANTDTATGLCPGGSGADTITLPANSAQTLTAVNNTTFNASGLPVISSTITVVGNNSSIVRAPGSPAFRILAVNGSGNLSVQSTTFSGGQTPPNSGGGGLYTRGILALTDCTVSGNSASDGGGIASAYGGSLTVNRSTVSGNTSQRHGGGIFDLVGATVTLTNSTVSGNLAQADFFGAAGGGISGIEGNVALTGSTVSGNTSLKGGGGIASRDGTITLNESTVTGNKATQKGGGILADGAQLNLFRSIVSGNSAAVSGAELYISNFQLVQRNFDIVGYNGDLRSVNFFPGRNDFAPNVPLSAILSPLADNGGPTQTHALPPGSPAINLVSGSVCFAATDQRGVNKPKGRCDIGAFEVGANSADLSTLKTASAPTVLVGGSLSFTLAVTNNGPENATEVQVVDGLPAQLTFVSATPTQGSCALVMGSVTCNLGGLANGASASVSLVTTAVTAGSVSNTASVISAPIIDVDPDTANNASTATVTIQPPPDTTPNAFTFMDQTNVPRNSVRTSNAVTISGINAPTPISVMGGGYSIGCTGTFTTAAGTINSGQTVCVRHTSSASFNSGVNTILTVGGVSDTFTSVTAKNAIAQLLGVVLQVITGLVGTVLGVLG